MIHSSKIIFFKYSIIYNDNSLHNFSNAFTHPFITKAMYVYVYICNFQTEI